MTLKRSFEHDRDSNTNSPPYESRTSSSKRQRRCFPMTVVSSSQETPTEMSFGNQSVFPDVQPILTAGKEKQNIILLFHFFHFKIRCFINSNKRRSTSSSTTSSNQNIFIGFN
jgi:hypothetical protein